MQPRVFDCFTFYNEFDLLELRLKELWSVVDYFVIAEANSTHQNNPKPFYLKDNFSKFEQYKDKIRLVTVEDMPMSPDTWVNERFQRRAIQRGLHDLRPTDIVIVSDCDEIPRSNIILDIKNATSSYDRYNLHVILSCFKLNYVMVNPKIMNGNIMVTKGRAFTNPQTEREYGFPWTEKPADIQHLYHAGWHFSYFGGTEFAKNKIKNFAHSETNNSQILNSLDVDELIKHKVFLAKFNGEERFEYVKVDDYFPLTVINNLEHYAEYIIPNAEKTVFDIYPNK